FWLLFKSPEPINLKCYKRTITATGSGYDTSGAATADLKFIYADENSKRVEELHRVSASDSGTVPTNQAPYTPGNPYPENNTATVTSNNLKLSWTGNDPDGDAVTYTVYFSDSEANLTSSANLLPSPYTPTVINGKTYYWKVVSTDSGLLTTEGPVWSFTVSDNTTPVETEAVEFFDKNNNNISTTGLSLKKGDSSVVTVKIEPPHSNLTFELESSDSESITLSATSLDFISTSSPTLTFKVTANDDITSPVTISLNTTNPDYKKEGKAYTLTITGNNPPEITNNGGGDTASISVKESEETQSFVTIINTDSTDSSSLSYSIDGADETKFTIHKFDDSNDAVIMFNNHKPHYNDVYNIKVTVKDLNGEDYQNINITVIEDNGDANESPKLSDTSRIPENRSTINTDTTTLSWAKATDKEAASLTYALEYWTLTDKSDKKIITEVKEVGNTEQVQLTGLKDNTTYNWLVWAYDGKNAAFGTEWLFSVKLPKVPVPTSNIMEEVKSISQKPVTPTTTNVIAQPLAAGDLTQGLTLSYSYPSYNAPVDVYVVMYYKNQFLFITKDGEDFIPTTEFKPLFSNETSAKSGTIFSIPNGLLKQFGLTGEYIFFSGVTPAGDTGFTNYNITWFAVNLVK
ncbi:MAG: fibronectin type III domain-containing protein, partial [Desulfamplus sp.]|nr:fibronectin type III domain-containing protein [Desulfamplus sp.]